MIFQENPLLVEYSHEMMPYFCQKLGKMSLGKMSQNLSSAAVVIGSLRVHNYIGNIIAIGKSLLKNHTGPLNAYFKLLYILYRSSCRRF